FVALYPRPPLPRLMITFNTPESCPVANIVISCRRVAQWLKAIPIVLLLALFSTLSIAQETAPFTPDQEKQIENLIHAALFNDPASPRIGAKHPKLTLVNFTDYNCP
ncbi:copper sensitivity supression protein, partial [Salmonella enterica subsp. enterica serovar Newport str. VA_R100506907]